MTKKLLLSSLSASIFLLLCVTSAFAHVVVNPNETGVGESQTFNIEVPTEKDNPTVGVKILLPDSLQEVTPVAKSGWEIAVKKNGSAEDAAVTEIDWTGGQVPVDQMNIFSFRAQVPSKTTTLQWKAYQTYQDGSVVAWDQTPNGSDDATGDKGPYSETKVVNDLSAASTTKTDTTTQWVAYLALVLGAAGTALSLRKK